MDLLKKIEETAEKVIDEVKSALGYNTDHGDITRVKVDDTPAVVVPPTVETTTETTTEEAK
jgi:hypothetical protein